VVERPEPEHPAVVVVAVRGALELAQPALGAAFDFEPVQREDRPRRDRLCDRGFRLEERLGQERRPCALLLRAVLEAPLDFVADGPREARRVVEDDHGVVANVRKERLEVVVVGGQERVGAEERAAARDVVDERARLRRGPIHGLRELRDPRAGAGAGPLVEDRLANGR